MRNNWHSLKKVVLKWSTITVFMNIWTQLLSWDKLENFLEWVLSWVERPSLKDLNLKMEFHTLSFLIPLFKLMTFSTCLEMRNACFNLEEAINGEILLMGVIWWRKWHKKKCMESPCLYSWQNLVRNSEKAKEMHSSSILKKHHQNSFLTTFSTRLMKMLKNIWKSLPSTLNKKYQLLWPNTQQIKKRK